MKKATKKTKAKIEKSTKLPIISGDVIALIASWAIIVGTAVLFYNVFG